MGKTMKAGNRYGKNTKRYIKKTIPSFNQMYRNRVQLSSKDKEILKRKCIGEYREYKETKNEKTKHSYVF